MTALFDLPFSHAFQPIVDLGAQTILAYEALVRGPAGEGAGTVFARIADGDQAVFDRASQLRAVALAGRLAIGTLISLNAMPRSMTAADGSFRELIAAADAAGLDGSRIILELTENEAISDPSQFARAVDEYRGAGFRLAIDDFGAGYSGLNLLADFQPDMIKLDMNLIRGIESHGPRQSIVRAIASVCEDLGIDIIAEGVETAAECEWLRREGVVLFQGYLFAAPAFERLPAPLFPSAG